MDLIATRCLSCFGVTPTWFVAARTKRKALRLSLRKRDQFLLFALDYSDGALVATHSVQATSSPTQSPRSIVADLNGNIIVVVDDAILSLRLTESGWTSSPISSS